MPSVRDFSLTYNVLNETGTFSEGDTLTGTVSFMLKDQTKVKSLFVKATGDANVHWTEGGGDDESSYRAHRRYFKVKEYLIPENSKDNVLPQGIHHFKFQLRIPEGNMPSSFRGSDGKIVYIVTAKMSRKWRFSCEVQKELNFVSASMKYTYQGSQAGSVEKQMGGLFKGQVQMSATVDRKACAPGQTVVAVARINNSSSKTMKPKFNLIQEVVCRAGNAKKTSVKSVCKMVGDTINPQTEESVCCPMKIPHDLAATIRNCEILSVEYYLKVYLDIKFAFDPEVRFPLDVTAAAAFGGPSSSDFPPPVSTFGISSSSNFPPPASTFGISSSSDFPPPATAFGGPSSSGFPPHLPAAPMGLYPVPSDSGIHGYPPQILLNIQTCTNCHSR
ncbi:hypothetical protein LDENG_00157760 [Lucifuga dentata]|nr:hypothetical protein LDENG_00157760 [Lucifuga dentata]